MSNICKKAGNELFVLSAYLGTDKLRLLMRASVTSQFQYCPLVWMFHRKLNNKINSSVQVLLICFYEFCLAGTRGAWSCEGTERSATSLSQFPTQLLFLTIHF